MASAIFFNESASLEKMLLTFFIGSLSKILCSSYPDPSRKNLK